ncbi:MAG: TIGR03084 family metal-binding protein [Deferribacterales bacterium]
MKNILNDLIAEQSLVDNLVSGLADEQWLKPVPGTGTWTIRETIVHIAFFDYAAKKLMTGEAEDLMVISKEAGQDEYYRSHAYDGMSGADALRWWREERTRMTALFFDKDPKDRIPWAPGLPMSARSLASARLMELWAHSVDIYDSLGLDPVVEDRIAHTLFLSWQARANAYRINGFELPETPLYLELTLPGGGIWEKGDPAAENCIKGTAKDWALVSIRRRNWHNTGLKISGSEAERYANVVQTYAGRADKAPETK